MRTGPRHAAPKKPLFTRFHMPAGKAIASVAMPTAVLVGLGFTSSLALADNNDSSASSNSMTAKEYKDCVAALKSQDDSSASPSPSASASGDSAKDSASPTPSATSSSQKPTSEDSSSGKSSSSDSGSGNKATPEPSASSSASKSDSSGGSDSGDSATATPSASASGNVLDTIGDAIKDVFTGGSSSSSSDSSSSSGSDATPSASPSPSASEGSDSSSTSSGKSASDTVKDTTDKVSDTVKKTVKDTTDTASKAAENVTKSAKDAADAATASPSPSASSTTDASDCPAATDAVSGVDNKTLLADDPWYLDASSLTLKGADYKGIVKVRTANGTVKRVLKYVISGGTDIGDLHQTVKDKQAGKTYHVQGAKGSTSTITDGDTVMYTESISGNLLGLIPVTFTPDSPPPLNIPLIYMTKVHVVQAAQMGGTLHIPGMHVYTTDGTG